MAGDKYHLLICTVGGTPEPIIAAVRHWKPTRVLLVHSRGTKSTVEAIENEPELPNPGACDTMDLHDAQEDFGECVRRMRSIDEQVGTWRGRGPGYDVIVDFTGGTKCMSAALSLVSRRWPCAFSYIGGTERTKGGIGIVVSGKEKTLFTQNPWNALGYQSIEDACLLFDQHAFAAAASLLEDARKAADDDAVKRLLSTCHQLCDGYGLWDRFRHKDAAQRIANVEKNATDLQAMLGSNRSEAVLRSVKQHRQHLQALADEPRSRAMAADLIGNACRRKHEGRYDDAVARLYRAIESIAQLALAERHEIQSTDDVALDRIPESLRERWAPRAEDGKILLGLQDAYLLLTALEDQTGKAFKKIGLHDPQRSPLTARNQSVLAHGFQPVGAAVFDQLWNAAMTLGEFEAGDLPVFPRLSHVDARRAVTLS
jgi:CRISPR-associated protein (TIGR02710 family)